VKIKEGKYVKNFSNRVLNSSYGKERECSTANNLDQLIEQRVSGKFTTNLRIMDLKEFLSTCSVMFLNDGSRV
jgi:hypothetical protein